MMALLAVVVAGCASPTIPSTVEEAYDGALSPDLPKRIRNVHEREVYQEPPGNVRAEDMLALLGGTVFVERIFDNRPPKNRDWRYDGINIFAIDGDGRVYMCVHEGILDFNQRAFTRKSSFTPEVRIVEGNPYPLLVAPGVTQENKGYGGGFTSPLYDPATGVLFAYTFGRNFETSWFAKRSGHIQKRLPASVYTLCPDFPSAESLGFEVNEAQTATRYRAMSTQDPGRRILRPDLVTPDARLTYR